MKNGHFQRGPRVFRYVPANFRTALPPVPRKVFFSPYSTAISKRTRLTALGPVIIRRIIPSFCNA